MDNNHETTLGDISEYIGNMFNINSKYIFEFISYCFFNKCPFFAV